MQIRTPAQELLYTTVRVESEGGANGPSTGTGFVFRYPDPVNDAGSYLFLVTNKHVVAGSTACTFFLTARDGERPRIGDRLDVRVELGPGPGWQGHPDPGVDVAVMGFGRTVQALTDRGTPAYFRALTPSTLPTDEKLDYSDALEDVVFVGYPNGIYDETNLLPVLRRGITATPPHVDYGGKPVVLIDAAVFPGSSGSPVFVWKRGGIPERMADAPATGIAYYFLGSWGAASSSGGMGGW